MAIGTAECLHLDLKVEGKERHVEPSKPTSTDVALVTSLQLSQTWP